MLAVLNPGERELRESLRQLTEGRPVWLSPKVRVLDVIDIDRADEIAGRELDYVFRSHFDLVLINSATLLPIAAEELDGQQHESDPWTQARDRLKDSLPQGRFAADSGAVGSRRSIRWCHFSRKRSKGVHEAEQ